MAAAKKRKSKEKTKAKTNVKRVSTYSLVCESKLPVEPGAVVINPGSQKENKTGTWRSFRPIISNEKCTACRLCVRHCPDAAISMTGKDGKAKVDYDYCKGCLICEQVCPFDAITSEVEQK